jgi:hypothetical protein
VERHVYLQPVISVSWRYENPTKGAGLVQSGRHHFIEMQLVLVMILLNKSFFSIIFLFYKIFLQKKDHSYLLNNQNI